MTYEERLSKLNPIEAEYRRRMSALTPAERLARTFEMFEAIYQFRKEELIRKNPELTGRALTYELAKLLYPGEPILAEMK